MEMMVLLNTAPYHLLHEICVKCIHYQSHGDYTNIIIPITCNFNKVQQTKYHFFRPHNNEYAGILSPVPSSKVDFDCKNRLFIHHMPAGKNQIVI